MSSIYNIKLNGNTYNNYTIYYDSIDNNNIGIIEATMLPATNISGSDLADINIIFPDNATTAICYNENCNKYKEYDLQIFQIVNYGYLYNWYSAAQADSIEYGFLYNWFAVDTATTGTYLANTGWHVPTKSEYQLLSDYIGGGGDYTSNSVGDKLKETGLTHWTIAYGTNEYLFNARGSSVRSQDDGTFGAIKTLCSFWCSDTYNTTRAHLVYLNVGDHVFYTGTFAFDPFSKGQAIRLVKDSTTLSHGQIGVYVGNDGRAYKTICIGTQEWLSENLLETKYRDGSSIPEITDNTTWAGLTTGARCSYDNTTTNAVVSTYLANTGWHVPTNDEWWTLTQYGGYDFTTIGGLCKVTGTTNWLSPNTGATNAIKFNGKAGDLRSSTGSFFTPKLSRLVMWTSTYWDGIYAYSYVLFYNSTYLISNGSLAKYGHSVRLLKDSTTLSHGQTGTYLGNDGKLYRTICIGTQEWLSENLMETKYRDGSLINVVTDSTDWSLLTTGGRCVYNNDELNA